VPLSIDNTQASTPSEDLVVPLSSSLEEATSLPTNSTTTLDTTDNISETSISESLSSIASTAPINSSEPPPIVISEPTNPTNINNNNHINNHMNNNNLNVASNTIPLISPEVQRKNTSTPTLE
jgi:hypothetical protein